MGREPRGMASEPTPEELRRRLEQSFERWRKRLDDPPDDEQADDDSEESPEET